MSADGCQRECSAAERWDGGVEVVMDNPACDETSSVRHSSLGVFIERKTEEKSFISVSALVDRKLFHQR